MNTVLMEAYEAMRKIRAKRSNDPQDGTLLKVMDVLWKAMEEDEIEIP